MATKKGSGWKIERQAWIRFFIALAGLALAFASAMYSTIFRREGNLTGTAIAASVALVTAGFVGLYTVPYLAKRAALEGLKEAFDYDVTREGLVYLGIALLVSVAALNTGNNLLFIIVAAMLAAILVSGMASAMVLRSLTLDVTLPSYVFAQQEVMARVILRNRFPFASFSVSVVPPRARDYKRFYWEKSKFVFPAQEKWIQWPDRKLRIMNAPPAPDAIFHGSVYFPYIAARHSAFADVELKFPKRGRYAQEGFGLSTRFPFSFLVKTRQVKSSQELIAFPSVQPTDEFFQVLPMITGEFESYVRGRGNDLYQIREHMPGDSARLVDWKATAKSGSLKVREFTREDERKLRMVFDNATPGRVSDASYESAVALAASLAWHFSATNTELSYCTQGYDGSTDVLDFLRHLALVEPGEEASLLPSLQATGDYNVIITAQPQGSLPTQLWASSYIIFMEQGVHGTGTVNGEQKM